METASGEGDFRMMRRCVADAILQLGESNRYTKGIFAYVGFRTSWIEYENVARSIGESKWNLCGLLRYAAQGIFAFSDAPAQNRRTARHRAGFLKCADPAAATDTARHHLPAAASVRAAAAGTAGNRVLSRAGILGNQTEAGLYRARAQLRYRIQR